MDVETGAMYAGRQAALDDAGRNAVSAARLLMNELEGAARTAKALSLVLQTGHVQVQAMALYESIGYKRIDAFGDYEATPFSVCYEKTL